MLFTGYRYLQCRLIERTKQSEQTTFTHASRVYAHENDFVSSKPQCKMECSQWDHSPEKNLVLIGVDIMLTKIYRESRRNGKCVTNATTMKCLSRRAVVW